MRFGRGAALLTAAVMAGGLAGCGGGDEPTEPTTTVSPRTPVGQGKTSDASEGQTSDASESSGGSSSGEPTEASSSSSSGDGGGGSDSSAGAGDLPDDMPAVATKQTKEGAAAFGQFYYDQLGVASVSGDPRVLKSLGLPSCPPCEQAVKNIRKDGKKGQHYVDNPYQFEGLEAKRRPDKGYKVWVQVSVSPVRVVKNGKTLGRVEKANYRLTEQVVWKDGVWRVADWTIS